MGALCSGEAQSPEERKRLKIEKDRSKRLEQQMSAAQSADQQINKLLLLGAGESGKSTLFKQMITIYGAGFPDHECKSYAPIIYNNILTSIQTLTEQASIMNETIAAKDSFSRIDEIKGDEEIDKELAGHIKALWADEGIQRVYARRAQFQLTDSAAYFFNKIDDVAEEGYVPSEQDVLRSRVRTTGIVENEFVIEENQFKMFDVGGQRNERKKWIHCFENVTAVLFVAAISAYDQVLYEDENTNRMHEALNLFREICNSRWFELTSMILFLNKRDLFKEKILTVSIKKCFPEYEGEDGDYNEAVEYIQAQFESRNEHPDTKKLYPHVTCATDTENVAHVFDSVKDIVIRDSLDQAGLV